VPHRLTLDVLTRDEARALLSQLLGEDRVQAERHATAELAQLCGYLPLALRIAAANLANHPHARIADYVTELHRNDRLAALEVEGDRQAAIRAAFDLSYAALEPDVRDLFRLLSLVPGPDFTIEVAAAISGTTLDHARHELDCLVGAHLIEQLTQGRFTFHDLLRLYAKEHAGNEDSAHDRAAAMQRLSDFYLHAADSAAQVLGSRALRLPGSESAIESLLVTFSDPTAAMAWLNAEGPSLIAATTRAALHWPRPVAWLVSDTLRGYVYRGAYAVDWFTVAYTDLPSATAEGKLRAHAAALNNLGCVFGDLCQFDHAIAHHTQALDLWGESGFRGGEAVAHTNLSGVCWLSGRLEQAAAHGVRALSLFREIGSKTGEAIQLNNIGVVYSRLGRLDDALVHLTRALAISRELGSRHREADNLHDLICVHSDFGRFDLALELAPTGLALARTVGDSGIEANILNILAASYRRLGHCSEAIDHHERALALACDTGYRHGEIDALLGLAAVRLDLGQGSAAFIYAQRAHAMAQQAGYRVLEGPALTLLAHSYLAKGKLVDAVELAERSVAAHRQTGQRLGEARALHVFGLAIRAKDGIEAARPYWEEALALFTDIGAPEAGQLRGLLDEH
jgi:tetratricopeptide (TPR) repeat protein